MENVSCKIRQKAENIFPSTASKFQKILTLNICHGAKQIYPKKKDSKERYSMNFSSNHPEMYSKKSVLKKFATCLLSYH